MRVKNHLAGAYALSYDAARAKIEYHNFVLKQARAEYAKLQ